MKSKAFHHLRIRQYVTSTGERRTLYYAEMKCWDGKERSWPAGDNRANALKLRDVRLGQNAQRYNFEAEKQQHRAKTYTLKAWSARWLDLHKHKQSIDKDHLSVRRLLDYFGDCSLEAITAARIEDYKAQRLGETTKYKSLTKPATVNRELAMLRTLLIQAVREDILTKRPQIAILDENNKRQRTASEGEYQTLLGAILPAFRPLLVTLWELGLRISEATNLTWSQVDFQRDVLFLGRTKAGDNEHVPLSDVVKKELFTLHEHRTGSTDRVFLTANGKPITRFDALAALKAACVKTKIQGLWLHDFRGTFITRKVASEGFDREVVKQVTRHRSDYAFNRYVRPTEAHVRAVVNKKPDTGRTKLKKTSHTR